MRKVKLGEVLDVKRGMSLSGEFYSETGEKIRLTLGNFNYPGGGFKKNTSKTDLFFTGPVKPEYILKKGDIITPLTEQVAGLLGETARIPEDNLYIQSGDIGLVLPDEIQLNKDFAYYLISSPIVKKQLGAAAQQTKIRHTSPDAIKACEVYLPNLEDQAKIAAILDALNAKIENNNAICAELEAMAKLLYDYWFVQFDFPDENGKPYKSSGGKMVWSEELKREIPEGWEACNIGEILQFQKGKIPDSLTAQPNEENQYPYLTIDVANGGMPEFCTRDRMPFCNGETIMVMDGAASGDVYVGNIGVLGSTFAMLIPKRKGITNAMIYWVLRANQSLYKRANTGSTVPHANRGFIEAMSVCIPRNLQFFTKAFDDIQSLIVCAKEENRELASLRDFLLPMLMNGQVSFKEVC